MELEWIGQLNALHREFCFCCKKPIEAGVTFYRAAGNQDTPDYSGYNACEKCRKKCPNPPQPKNVFENL